MLPVLSVSVPSIIIAGCARLQPSNCSKLLLLGAWLHHDATDANKTLIAALLLFLLIIPSGGVNEKLMPSAQ